MDKTEISILRDFLEKLQIKEEKVEKKSINLLRTLAIRAKQGLQEVCEIDNNKFLFVS